MYNTLYIPGLESVSDFQHYYHRFLKVLRLFSSDHQIRSEDEKQVPKFKIYMFVLLGIKLKENEWEVFQN